MSEHSNIEWTDATWNPTRGCSMATGSNSPECGGCYNCYAARQALRHAGPGGAYEGLVKLTPHGPRWTGKVVEGDMEAPLHWRTPRRVFVDSMSDLFHESIPDETIDRAFAVMALMQRHTFQVLTKRAERMRSYVTDETQSRVEKAAIEIYGKHKDWLTPLVEGHERYWPLFNVWLGVSCENQPTYQVRWEQLRRTPAAIRFLSLEPLLGPIVLDLPSPDEDGDCKRCGCVWQQEGITDRHECPPGFGPYPNWVIIGGESGPGARPFDLAYARDVIEKCKRAGVACFMNQMGSHVLGDYGDFPGDPPGWCNSADSRIRGPILRDKKGGNPAEWPEWARVREWPRA